MEQPDAQPRRDRSSEPGGRRRHDVAPPVCLRGPTACRGVESTMASPEPSQLRPGDDVVRILLYTGKGGVGKTSIAAATALLCAARGYRTIVLSTDIAHSLADAFDVPLGAEPNEIAPNLWGQEPDVYFNIGRYW